MLSKNFKKLSAAATVAVIVMAVGAFAQDLPKIAVYVTGNVGADEKKALGTRMLASLVNSRRYTGIERSESFVAAMDREQEKQRSGAVDDNQISKLGRQFGVEFICIADLTPVFGEYQVSARIVNVETAVVLFIGEASGKLNSMSDLSEVSNKVIENMFGEKLSSAKTTVQEPEDRKQLSPPAKSNNNTYQSYGSVNTQTAYRSYIVYDQTNFTGGQRWGTWAVNWLLPGVGSVAIMQDWTGAITQWVLWGGGIILMVNGFETRNETHGSGYYQYETSVTEPNALFWIGYGALFGNFVYNIVRSSTYKKKLPKNMAFLENAGLNIAVLPDKNGELKYMTVYNMEF